MSEILVRHNVVGSSILIFVNLRFAQAITKASITPWLQLRSSLVNNDLKNAFDKYLKNVKITYDKPDPREPDFMFYEGYDGVLNVYR